MVITGGLIPLTRALSSLFYTINHLASLCRLTLILNLPSLTLSPTLPILGRLSLFAIWSRGMNQSRDDTWLAGLLNQNSPPNYGSIDCRFPMRMEHFLGLDSALDTKLNRAVLSDRLTTAKLNHFTRFCSRFTQLTSLSIRQSTMSLAVMCRCLCRLSQLIN